MNPVTENQDETGGEDLLIWMLLMQGGAELYLR